MRGRTGGAARILKHRQTSDGRPNTVPLRSTVRVPDGLRSRRNSTGGLAITNYDRMPSFTPIRESFTHTFKNRVSTVPRARACAVGLRTDNDENRQLTTDASFENWRQRRCRCNADDANDAMMMRQNKTDTRRKRKGKGIFWNVGIGLSQLSYTTRGSRPEIQE